MKKIGLLLLSVFLCAAVASAQTQSVSAYTTLEEPLAKMLLKKKQVSRLNGYAFQAVR